METYDGKFIGQAMRDFADSVLDAESRQKISMHTSTEYSKASLKDVIRLVAMLQSNPTSEETTELRDKVARQLLVKVDVDFKQDGELIGRLTRITDASQSLESDAFLQDNWLFYQLVLDVTTGYVLKNFTAPPKLIPKAAGAGTGEGPRA